MTMSRQVSFEDTLLALQQVLPSAGSLACGVGLDRRGQRREGQCADGCSHPAIRPGSVCFWRVCFGKERHADLEREFIEDHWLVDERVPRVRRLGDGVLVPTSDLYTPEERETSPTYTELMGKNDMQKGLHARLDVPDGLQIVWALGDSTDTRGWSTTQTATIEKLMPHLRHFAAVRQVLADAKALNKSLVQLLDDRRTCVVQLDRTGGGSWKPTTTVRWRYRETTDCLTRAATCTPRCHRTTPGYNSCWQLPCRSPGHRDRRGI